MAFLPTAKYPRILYDPGTGLVTLDLEDGVAADGGEFQFPLGAGQIAFNGTREYNFFRSEETRQIALQWGHAYKSGASTVPPGALAGRIKKLLEDHANKGKQFEVLVNRFQGAVFEFDGVLTDENRNAVTYTPGGATYATSPFDKALTIAAADHVEIPRVPATNAPRLIATEGLILILVKPTWAGNDGVLHTLLDCGGPTTNRLRIRKTLANDLELEVLDNAAGSRKVAVAVSWSAATWQAIIGIYRTDGTLELWLNETQVGTPSGAGTGILNSLGATFFLASDTAGADRAAGDYERLALYTRGYTINSRMAAVLKEAVTRDRNYYATAELMQPTSPQRVHQQVELYQMPLLIRKGS
ncbi:MAG: hypothetical protein U1B94_09575 [candidate division NC10 bacterium]|nr:hypothetical protein [candidate division NC10 bacterium]